MKFGRGLLKHHFSPAVPGGDDGAFAPHPGRPFPYLLDEDGKEICDMFAHRQLAYFRRCVKRHMVLNGQASLFPEEPHE